jgi:hypothetical protein
VVQQPGEIGRNRWLIHVGTLHRIAGLLAQERRLASRFNALGDHRHAQRLAQRDEGFGDQPAVRILAHVAHQ